MAKKKSSKFHKKLNAFVSLVKKLFKPKLLLLKRQHGTVMLEWGKPKNPLPYTRFQLHFPYMVNGNHRNDFGEDVNLLKVSAGSRLLVERVKEIGFFCLQLKFLGFGFSYVTQKRVT